jgi:hypothetical protein
MTAFFRALARVASRLAGHELDDTLIDAWVRFRTGKARRDLLSLALDIRNSLDAGDIRSATIGLDSLIDALRRLQ